MSFARICDAEGVTCTIELKVLPLGGGAGL